MVVKRIVANIETGDPAAVASFYSGLLGLEMVMDQGWIVTLQGASHQGAEQKSIQLSAASQGGSGTAVPALSIEVDNLEDVHDRAISLGINIEYGPCDEPWGVRRFYVRDPAGTLINILTHMRQPRTN